MTQALCLAGVAVLSISLVDIPRGSSTPPWRLGSQQIDPTPSVADTASMEWMLADDANFAAVFGVIEGTPLSPGDIEIGTAIPIWGMPQSFFEDSTLEDPATLLYRVVGSWISTVSASGTLVGALEYHRTGAGWDYTNYIGTMGGESLLALQRGDKVVRDPLVSGYYILRGGTFVALDDEAATVLGSAMSAEDFVEWVRVSFPDPTADPAATSEDVRVVPESSGKFRPSLPMSPSIVAAMGFVVGTLVSALAVAIVTVRRADTERSPSHVRHPHARHRPSRRPSGPRGGDRGG